MLSIICQTKPACILQDVTMSLQHHASCQRARINYVFNSSLDTLQLPWTGPSRVTLTSTSSTTRLSEASLTRSSHPLVTAVTHLFRTPAIMHSQLQTGKWPTNLPHMRNMVRHVISAGGSGITILHFQLKVSHSPQTLRPSTLALCFRYSWSLQVKTKKFQLYLDLVHRYYFLFHIYVIDVG